MEEDDELKAILRDAFGDSSSESDGESPDNWPEGVQANGSGDEIARPPSVFGDSHVWEPIPEINGLWICRDFLSVDEQASLLSALVEEGYMADDSCNQAMRFGDLPPWALEISSLIRETVLLSGHYSESSNWMTGDNNNQTSLFPSELLWREPLFNQFIVNIYKPGDLCACRPHAV